MARREIEHIESGTFLKLGELFPKVGSKFQGIYLSDEPNEGGNYPGGTNFTFKQRNGEAGTISAKGSLEKQLKKLAMTPGELCTIMLVDERDVGQSSPKRIFKVAAEEAPKKGSKPAAPPPEDDTPF